MSKQVFTITPTSRRHIAEQVMNAPEGFRVEIKPMTRSLAQNDLMWSCLGDLSKQVNWLVNGASVKMPDYDWKAVITSGLRQENRIAAGIAGGFVMLGESTSKMGVKKMTEVIDFAHAFGTDHDVKWSPTSLGRYA